MPKKDRYRLPIAVFAILKNQNDEILLIKRENTGWMDGFYSLPAGGLEEDEALNMATIREIQEEIDVNVNPENLQLAHVIHCNIHEEKWLGYFFLTNSWIGTPKVNEPEKHSEVKWFKLLDLPHNTIPYVKQALESQAFYSNFGW